MTVVYGAPPPDTAVPTDPVADWLQRPALVAGTPATAAAKLLAGARGVLVGYAFIETTGTGAATFDLVDGLDANGPVVVPFALTPGQSTRDWFALPGIVIRRGLFLNVLTGSVRGSAFYVPRGMGG